MNQLYHRKNYDLEKIFQEEETLLKKMEENGKFDALTDEEKDCTMQMSIDQARDIVFGENGSCRKDAKLFGSDLHPVISEEIKIGQQTYLMAVNVLKKAGEL